MLVAMIGTGAWAQGAPPEICAGKASPAEEIACLRGALAQSEATLARVLAGQGQAAARPAAAPPPQVLPPAATSVPTPAPAPQLAEKPMAPTPAPLAPAPRAAPAGMGAEQIAGPRREAPASPTMQAVVVASEQDREGLLTLHLDSGQRWKQVEKPTLQIVIKQDRQYPVEISKSGFGGYRMYFADIKRTIVVKRIS